MVSRVTVKVDGLAQLEAAMKVLGAQAANRIARSALDRAPTPVVERGREVASTPGDPDCTFCGAMNDLFEGPRVSSCPIYSSGS